MLYISVCRILLVIDADGMNIQQHHGHDIVHGMTTNTVYVEVWSMWSAAIEHFGDLGSISSILFLVLKN